MEYHLFPPFFEIAPESSFDEAWESFCADILNLTNGTREIRRRTPPDHGVDLFWPTKRIAYQCKAVLHGKAGNFPAAKSISSIKRALEKRSDIGWDTYVLCVNVDPTGSQELKIKTAFSDIEFLTPSFWIPACREFSDAVRERFRLLVRVSDPHVERFIDETFIQTYAESLKANLREAPLMLRVFSNRRKEVFDVPVSREMTVDDFLKIMIRMFRLPRRKSYAEDSCSVSLSYSLMINDGKVSLNQKFGNLGLNDGSVVTLHKTMVFRDEQGETTESTIEMVTMWKPSRTESQRFRAAEVKYTKLFHEAFENALKDIIDDEAT